MAQFSLDSYELVVDRIKRFYEMHPDGRIITEDYTTENDRASMIWRVKATIFLNAGDQALGLPKSTGHAFEIDGVGMSQKTAALETCESSAIGRALYAMGLSGQKAPSREEMEKAQRGKTPQKAGTPVPDDFVALVESATTLDELKSLWADAVAGGYSKTVQDVVTKRKGELA
jgi:hypothetical protein